jgi:hypothetical protein
MISATRFHADKIAEALEVLVSRKHEQDPVRMKIFSALATLPPGRWKTPHLDTIATLIRQALDAADLSLPTGNYAELLVVRIAPFHPAWSALWLATLAKERGNLTCGQLGRLQPSLVHSLAASLLPVLKSWETREREGHIVHAAGLLGRRLRDFDELADILESLVKSSANSWTAEGALALLVQHRPDRIQSLIPALLAIDITWYRGEAAARGRPPRRRERRSLSLYLKDSSAIPAQDGGD